MLIRFLEGGPGRRPFVTSRVRHTLRWGSYVACEVLNSWYLQEKVRNFVWSESCIPLHFLTGFDFSLRRRYFQKSNWVLWNVTVFDFRNPVFLCSICKIDDHLIAILSNRRLKCTRFKWYWGSRKSFYIGKKIVSKIQYFMI